MIAGHIFSVSVWASPVYSANEGWQREVGSWQAAGLEGSLKSLLLERRLVHLMDEVRTRVRGE